MTEWEEFKGKCCYCGCNTHMGNHGPHMATIEHIESRALYGENRDCTKIALACFRCNQRKANMDLREKKRRDGGVIQKQRLSREEKEFELLMDQRERHA